MLCPSIDDVYRSDRIVQHKWIFFSILRRQVRVWNLLGCAAPLPGPAAAWPAPSAASASPSARRPTSSAPRGPPGAAPSGCSTDRSCPWVGALSLPGCLGYLALGRGGSRVRQLQKIQEKVAVIGLSIRKAFSVVVKVKQKALTTVITSLYRAH